MQDITIMCEKLDFGRVVQNPEYQGDLIPDMFKWGLNNYYKEEHSKLIKEEWMKTELVKKIKQSHLNPPAQAAQITSDVEDDAAFDDWDEICQEEQPLKNRVKPAFNAWREKDVHIKIEEFKNWDEQKVEEAKGETKFVFQCDDFWLGNQNERRKNLQLKMCPHIYNKEENESYKKIQSNWLYNLLDKEDKLKILQTRRPKYLEPSNQNYKAYLDNVKNFAVANPHEQVLSVQTFACHGMVIAGCQAVMVNKFDNTTQFYELMKVEAQIRQLYKTQGLDLSNIYFLCLFACCRESYVENSKTGVEKGKEITENQGPGRGLADISASSISNFTFLFGCDPAAGVSADTKFVRDFVDHLEKFFDPITQTVLIPEVLGNIDTQEIKVNFESVSSNLGRSLCLVNQEPRVGTKMLVVIVAESTQIDENTKKRIQPKRIPNEKTLFLINFFFEHLKFRADELLIINETDAISIDNFMNQSEIYKTYDYALEEGPLGEFAPRGLKQFAQAIFKDKISNQKQLLCVFLNESKNMDVRDFVANRNPEFALNVDLFEPYQDEDNLEGEEKEKFLSERKKKWDQGEVFIRELNEKRKIKYDNDWHAYLAPVLQKIQNLNCVSFQNQHRIFPTQQDVFTFCQWGGSFKKGTGQFDFILDLEEKQNKTIKPIFAFLEKHPVRQFPVPHLALGCCINPDSELQQSLCVTIGKDKNFSQQRNWVVLQSFYVEKNLPINDTIFELGFELQKGDDVVRLDQLYLDTFKHELYFVIIFKVSVGLVFGKVSYDQEVKVGDKAKIELRELRQLVELSKQKSYDSVLSDLQNDIVKITSDPNFQETAAEALKKKKQQLEKFKEEFQKAKTEFEADNSDYELSKKFFHSAMKLGFANIIAKSAEYWAEAVKIFSFQAGNDKEAVSIFQQMVDRPDFITNELPQAMKKAREARLEALKQSLEGKSQEEQDQAIAIEQSYYKVEKITYDRLNIEKRRAWKAQILNIGTKLENFKWELQYKTFKDNDLDEVYREVKNRLKINEGQLELFEDQDRKEALKAEKAKLEEDKKVLDEVLRDNSFLVFDNIEGANITKENKYTDAKVQLAKENEGKQKHEIIRREIPFPVFKAQKVHLAIKENHLKVFGCKDHGKEVYCRGKQGKGPMRFYIFTNKMGAYNKPTPMEIQVLEWDDSLQMKDHPEWHGNSNYRVKNITKDKNMREDYIAMRPVKTIQSRMNLDDQVRFSYLIKQSKDFELDKAKFEIELKRAEGDDDAQKLIRKKFSRDWDQSEIFMKRPSNFLKPSSDGPNRIIYTDLKSNYVFDMLMVRSSNEVNKDSDGKKKRGKHLQAFRKKDCQIKIVQEAANLFQKQYPKGFGLQKRPFVRHLDLICENFMSVIIQENEARWQRQPQDGRIDSIPRSKFKTAVADCLPKIIQIRPNLIKNFISGNRLKDILSKNAQSSFYFVFEQQKINLVSQDTQEEFLLIQQRATCKFDRIDSPWVTYSTDLDRNPTITLHYFESYYNNNNENKTSYYTTFQMTEDFINAIVSCGEIIPNEKSKLVKHVTTLQEGKRIYEKGMDIQAECTTKPATLVRKENVPRCDSENEIVHQHNEIDITLQECSEEMRIADEILQRCIEMEEQTDDT